MSLCNEAIYTNAVSGEAARKASPVVTDYEFYGSGNPAKKYPGSLGMSMDGCVGESLLNDAKQSDLDLSGKFQYRTSVVECIGLNADDERLKCVSVTLRKVYECWLKAESVEGRGAEPGGEGSEFG